MNREAGHPVDDQRESMSLRRSMMLEFFQLRIITFSSQDLEYLLYFLCIFKINFSYFCAEHVSTHSWGKTLTQSYKKKKGGGTYYASTRIFAHAPHSVTNSLKDSSFWMCLKPCRVSPRAVLGNLPPGAIKSGTKYHGCLSGSKCLIQDQGCADWQSDINARWHLFLFGDSLISIARYLYWTNKHCDTCIRRKKQAGIMAGAEHNRCE